ncbi:MAG: PhzF family phenazine biosynthesis protein [Caulobacterales bacterium]|nr:PhzF family phenazine biosynthesis protein [Caulobacterales bacterium]
MPVIPFFQVDAFTPRVFAGNPAAVCPVEAWPADEVLQAIAAENNLSETAFFLLREDGTYHLRWFTPTVEVALCGHATLASAHVLFTHLGHAGETVAFDCLSGRLTVTRDREGLRMDFPSAAPQAVLAPADVVEATGGAPEASFAIPDLHKSEQFVMLVYGTEGEVAALAPDTRALGAAGANVLVTAPGDGVDFVSRFFAPASGIDEDPATGSTHCTLAPYWGERLGRARLTARQISARGGDLVVEHLGARTAIIGRCADYARGEITLA